MNNGRQSVEVEAARRRSALAARSGKYPAGRCLVVQVGPGAFHGVLAHPLTKMAREIVMTIQEMEWWTQLLAHGKWRR
jgi:hypothetical protein